MILLKPEWVNHDDKPIFSVDVHPDCNKFVTGGLGGGDGSGLVRIWNIHPVMTVEAEADPNIPKLLCAMDTHLACVNSVRFSKNGVYLASGSDDKLVIIYHLAKGSSSGNFGSAVRNVENWKCAFTLRGHAGDVLDLAWSPTDRWLASCSVDNTIIVWDVQNFPSIVKVLKGHSGLVKGVAWDPVGKYIASQSDDRSAKIWKTSDWTCMHTVTDPFEECGGTTHILRLSWSPDGQYLVSAHSMNTGGPTAQIIEREGWKTEKDFVGHRKAVTCVRFHKDILKKQRDRTSKSQMYCALALGSRDHSLSVWMTCLKRPLFVVHQLFNDSVLDIAWGPNKYCLIACGGDGTVACFIFQEKDLGVPLSEDDKNAFYERSYGKSACNMESGTSGRDMIVENAEILDAVKEKVTLPLLSGKPSPQEVVSAPSPVPIPVQPDLFLKPAVVIENNNDSNASAIKKQIETRTADGKRRITPVFIPVNQEQGEIVVSTQLSSSSRSAEQSESTLFAQPAPSPVITSAEKCQLDNRLTKTTAPTAPIKSVSVLNSISTASIEKPAKHVSGPAKLNVTSTSKDGMVKSYGDYRIQIQNGNLNTPMGNLSRIWGWCRNEKIWEVYCGAPVVNFTLSLKYALVCCQDGTIRISDIKSGSNILPIMCMATSAVQCTFCPLGKLAGVISECGQIRIWNIDEQKIFLSSSCSDIFSKSGHVVQFQITENGIPFILFSNGNAYSYSIDMSCWMQLYAKDAVFRQGFRSVIPKDFQRNMRQHPLMTVQSTTNNFLGNALSGMDSNANNWQDSAKMLFIENQIKLCEKIKSPEELKYWYLMLGHHLAASGTEKKLRTTLDDLMGSAHGFKKLSPQSDDVLGVSKHYLLESILDVLKKYPKWQRIYMEYYEQFVCVKTKTDSMEE